MNVLEEKISLLDENFEIKNKVNLIHKIKERIKDNKKREKYNPTYIEIIVEALKEKLRGKNKNFSDLNLEEWLDPDGIASNFAKKAKIERTQLRKYFDEIKNIKVSLKGLKENEDLPPETRIKLMTLIPKFAYAKGRDLIGEDVYEFFSYSLRKIKEGKIKDFEAFENIIESILAYHTYHKPRK